MSDEQQNYPSLAQQGKNLAKFGWDLIQHTMRTSGNMFVNDAVYEERMTICRSCDKYDEQQQRCRECGCYLPGKARMILDSCPLQKWTADEKTWTENFENVVKQIEETPEQNGN